MTLRDGHPSVAAAAGEAVILPKSMSALEYRTLVGQLGRSPNALELTVVAALWSEHCSYKSTRHLLPLLRGEAPQLVLGPGHNAGAVAIGQDPHGHDCCAVFKMESHNHPSFLEPIQGAATGVGGILRDVLAMGARPIALLDALRFGDPQLPLTRRLAQGVVEGIAWFGNCVGVPVVGGNLACASAYNGNPLVNVLALGLVRRDRLQRAVTGPPGSRLVLLGAATGRDGVGGATMASATFSAEPQDSARQRPSVQIGDPFVANCVIQATLEVLGAELALGLQDLGAAGLTSAAFEMAVRSGTGLHLDLDRVTLCQAGMTPEEILISESQERMVIAAAPEQVAAVCAVARRWGLAAEEIGQVIAEPVVRCNWRGAQVLELPTAVADGWVPQVLRPSAKPAPWAQPPPVAPPRLPARASAAQWLALLGDPAIASKAALWRNFDWQVQGGTAVGPGLAEAAIVQTWPGGPSLALTADCCERYARAAPRAAAQHAVAEACRNLACTGAAALGLTDCLNFGSPEDPETMWSIIETFEGLGDAARALGCPIVSGNVSLYNATGDVAVPPTAMIGAVGLLPAGVAPCPAGFQGCGDEIWLVGRFRPGLAGTLWARCQGHPEQAPANEVDFAAELALGQWLCGEVAAGRLRSALDVSAGGLAIALAKACLRGAAAGLGCDCAAAALAPGPHSADSAELWFGETSAAAVVSCAPDTRLGLTADQQAAGLTLQRLGTVLPGEQGVRAGPLHLGLDELARPWRESVARLLSVPPVGADFPLYVRDLCNS